MESVRPATPYAALYYRSLQCQPLKSNMRIGAARNSRGQYFQLSWDPADLILELRAAKEALLALSTPGDRVRFHIDNRSACACIRDQGGTKSTFLSKEAVDMWQQAIFRNTTILIPHWISSEENAEADFLSRNDLSQWDFYFEPEI